MAHPTGLGVPHAVKYRTKRDTRRIAAHDIIADQPGEINNPENDEHNQSSPSAWTKEEGEDDKCRHKNPDCQGIAQREETKAKSDECKPDADPPATVLGIHCSNERVDGAVE